MKYFIKNFFLFGLVIILIFTSINFFQNSFNTDPIHYRKQYESIVKKSNDYSGIIIGTSHATHSLRPSILDASGIKYYNYSLNGSNPEYYYKWYKNFIHNNEIKPKHCLYVVDFFMFDEEWLIRKFEQDVEYFPFKIFLNELLNTRDFNKIDLIVNRFPFIKYKNKLINSLKLQKGSCTFKSENYDRGYISFTLPFDSLKFIPKLNYKIYPKQIHYFNLLINLMLKDNIKIIFVMAPEYGIKVEEYYQMKSLKFIDYISKKLNLDFLNFNTQYNSFINKNIIFFSDWGHMNHTGAKIFSISIARRIQLLNKKRKVNQSFEKE